MAIVLTDRVLELSNDRTHGASWLARRAVETLVEVSAEPTESAEDLLERLIGAGRELADSRPGVGAVAGAVGRLLAAAHRQSQLPADELRRVIQEEAQALISGRDRAAASIAIQLRDRLTGATVLTHSASATVREALTHTPPELVICTVSAPVEEGRWFTEELRETGLTVELVEDEDAVAELSRASLLLLGADTVFRDGTLCNKIGTRRLAEAAAEEGIPTVIACEVIKLAPIGGSDAPELTGVAATLFDVTPGELLTEIVTEEGTHPAGEIGVLVDRTPFLREGYALLAATPSAPAS